LTILHGTPLLSNRPCKNLKRLCIGTLVHKSGLTNHTCAAFILSASLCFVTALTASCGSAAPADSYATSKVAQNLPLIIVGDPLPEVDAGAPYAATLEAEGGISPYRWRLADGILPPGLELGGTSGAITGTSTVASSYPFVVQVTDSGGQTSKLAFSLTVYPALAVVKVVLPQAYVGIPYSAILSATGGVAPYLWNVAVGSLAPGLELQTSNGSISGVATLTGSYAFSVRVTDSSAQSATTGLILVVPSPNPSPSSVVALPEVWVNNHEGDRAFNYELSLPGTWMGGEPPMCVFHAPYWTELPISSGLQSAINDIESCRTTTGVGIKLDIPPGLYTSTDGIAIPQSNDTFSTSFLILDSTLDSDLPNGTIVCAKDIGDNVPLVSNIGLINPDCAGDALAYELGKTVTIVPAGTFTLANGTPTNTSNYNDVQYMWTLECSGTNCSALSFCNASGTAVVPACTTNIGPDHWLIEDAEMRMNEGNTGDANVISMTAGGASAPTALSQFPTHVHLRKIWQHGDWTSLTAGRNRISAGMQMSCSYCSLVDSQFSQNLRPGAEGHSLYVTGPGPYKIDHNWLEGQSSGIFSGGNSTTPNIAGFVPFQDVEMRRNRFTFPYAWLGQMTIPGSNSQWEGQSIVRKNCTEFKEGERILRDGNICENVDNSGAQNGTVTVINVRQTSGTGANGNNYQATINDVTYTNEIDRNACEGIEIAARSGDTTNGGGVAYPLRRISIGNVLEYNISMDANPGCGGNKFGIQMASAGQSWKGTINGDGTEATFVATCSVDGGDCPSGPPSVGFQVMNMAAGDPVWVSECTSVTLFNAATHTVDGSVVPVIIGPLLSSGSAAWTGTFNSAGVTVSWPSTVTGTDTSGNCTVSNIQGGPYNVAIDHHTLITDANQAIGNGNTNKSGPNFQMNHVFINSIITNSGTSASGWYNSVAGEGNPTEQFNYDYTSMTAGFNVWPTRMATKYRDYGNAPGNSLTAGCTGGGCNPPATSFFPTTSYCAGETPTSTCVGFIGAMSTTSLPLAMSDYHGYSLISGSTFEAGGSGQASDGTDMGVSIPSIDAAQNQTKYVCSDHCGTPGPFSD
jgi:Putative Ig domain